ncbi:MAG TPA: hypothetical protein PL193_03805, partial [Xanthobacteraceae bacterium]|nr:hypothetical protein [Xanthobacteraceae bacterium]
MSVKVLLFNFRPERHVAGRGIEYGPEADVKNKKSQDPTEAALSAIEDALNIGAEAPEVAPPASDRRGEPRVREPANDVFAQRSRRTRERLPRRAANDDRQSVGQILQALHRKPSNVPMLSALFGSIVWIIGGAALAASQYRTAEGAVMRLSEIAAQPSFPATMAAILLPPLVFFMTALLIRRSQEMRQISRAMTEVTLRLAEPEGVSTDAIVSVGQAIRREVAALGDGIERAVARASELETMVRSEVATLEQAYGESENRVRALIHDLHGERQSVIEHATQVRDAIATAHEAFAFDVQNIADRVASALDNATGRITDNISVRAEEARAQIVESGNSLVENLINRAEEARSNIHETGSTLVDAIVARAEEARRNINETGSTLAETLLTRAEEARSNFHQTGSVLVDTLETRAEEARSRINDTGSTLVNSLLTRTEEARSHIHDTGNILVDTLVSRANEAHGKINQTGQTLVETLVTRAEDARSRLGDTGTKLVETLVTRAEEARNQINQTGNSVAEKLVANAEAARIKINDSGNGLVDNLVRRAEEANKLITRSGNMIVESLGEKSAEATQRLTDVGVQIAQAIADRNEKVSEALLNSTEDINKKLAVRMDGIAQMVSETNQTFENTIGTQLKNFSENVIIRGNEIATKISADAGTLGARMAESVQNFDTTVKVYGANIVNEIKSTIDSISKTSHDSLASMDQRVAGKVNEVSDQLDQRITRIEQTLDGRVKSLNETLANRTLEFAKTLSEGSKAATEEVQKSVDGMGEYFAARTAEMASTLAERAERIDETLGNRANQLTDTLDTRVNKFEELIVSRLESVAGTIENKGIAVTDLLVERVGSVNDLISGTAAEVERNLNSLATNITEQFIERVNNITGAHETLRSEVRDIISELGQTHHILQAAIDTASSTLGPIEGKVAEKVALFHQTLDGAVNATRATAERMDRQIRELNESSNGVLRDVSHLTLRFEEQVRLVAATTESLNETHRRIDQGMEKRKETITEVSTLLTERSGELEERLIRFNKMLGDTFLNAQNKAQEVARLVAESTANATQSISQQYELIRNSSIEERERTNLALKDTYDETLRSVGSMFAETNSRFLEASRDLREISDDIQRTLDTTREEIRRTVFDLPTETKESANAMRRVVADQIRALSELNDIVARHSREYAGSAGYEYREEEVAAVGGRPAARGLPRPDYDEAPAPRGRDHAPEPRRERKADRSARFDEALNKPERAPEPEEDDSSFNIDSLDALSIDIARMIDHDAASEAWERFKRGERG